MSCLANNHTVFDQNNLNSAGFPAPIGASATESNIVELPLSLHVQDVLAGDNIQIEIRNSVSTNWHVLHVLTGDTNYFMTFDRPPMEARVTGLSATASVVAVRGSL